MFNHALMGGLMRKKDIVTPATLGAEIWLSATAIEGANENDNIGTMPDVIDGVDAVQAEAAKQPTYQLINGMPYLLFDGSNDFMEAPYDFQSKYDQNSEITIGVVWRSSLVDTSTRVIWAGKPGGGPHYFMGHRKVDGTDELWFRHGGGDLSLFSDTDRGIVDVDMFSLVSVNSGNLVVDVNGTNHTETGDIGPASHFSSLNIGCRFTTTSPQLFYQGYVKDWFLIPRLLTPEEKTALYENREAY